ncbi:hypothetical protein FJV83_19215 [Mesorhizobium sp. WSM4307]|uniref:antitoxin Xre/MbcA/ParS-like domain-containing protein n=1 Tax=unclassified Mesorhizobium TaxID=325217 RepID=UPI000BAF447B|nr:MULTISPECIES: hypothetical protein [unclassified Mesorhizobium]PBB24486.1 hypothetical protein CK232_22860 [Mesorhizobium sp. WSM4304]PBB74546.1 hypothetical protein CK227_14555 [Mesorhizobium sp. WSM4308]TRC73292.1 hypothetical protein FJV81_25685 [Mesorhizobium sp. WSM4315]TRC83571.1 hypothetical protein FJV83_19215 [Mesorhizobium sp. WSM4307]
MAKLPDIENGPRQEELSSLVAKEVRRVLTQYDEVVKEHNSISSCEGECKIGVASSLSLTLQQAIHDDLTVLASGFVSRLAAEAARRFDVSAEQEASLAGQIEGTPKRWVSKVRNQKNECLQIQAWAGQIAGPTHLEEHYGIARSTLHWWQRHNDVVALRKGARKHVFPLAQFIDGRPAPGIRQVLASIANPRLAWLWLTRPSSLLEGRIPIEMLRQDLAEEVILAARDFAANADLAAFDVITNEKAP